MYKTYTYLYVVINYILLFHFYSEIKSPVALVNIINHLYSIEQLMKVNIINMYSIFIHFLIVLKTRHYFNIGYLYK